MRSDAEVWRQNSVSIPEAMRCFVNPVADAVGDLGKPAAVAARLQDEHGLTHEAARRVRP